MPHPKDRLQRLPIYTSTSMLRVFSPGDFVETDDSVPFEELQVGDIIVFPSVENPEKRFIHRIIRSAGDSLITMGDNNPAPDSEPVTASQKPSLAIARVLPDGRRIPLARGESGMRQFRMNRCRRWWARLLRSIGRLVEPIMFWRMRLTETKQFGEDVFYYAGKRAIAKKTENGPRYLKSYWRLLYKVK